MQQPNKETNPISEMEEATIKRATKGRAKKTAPPQAPLEPALEMPKTEAGIERYAREKERATKRVIAASPMVPVWIDPVIGREGEVLTYRLNGVTYHIKTRQIVQVPEALAMVIYDQARRKKLSARYVQEYITGYGKGLGELK